MSTRRFHPTGLANLLITLLLLRRFDVWALGAFGFVLLGAVLLMLGAAPSFAFYAPAYVAALAGVAYFNIFNRTQRVKVIPMPITVRSFRRALAVGELVALSARA